MHFACYVYQRLAEHIDTAYAYAYSLLQYISRAHVEAQFRKMRLKVLIVWAGHGGLSAGLGLHTARSCHPISQETMGALHP